MPAATERIVVLMTKAEKRALEAKARRMGTSTAELVRRSVDAFEEGPNSEEIGALLDALTVAHQSTLRALDRAEHEVAETRRWFESKRRGKS